LKIYIIDEIKNKEIEIEELKYINIAKDEEIDVTLEYPSKNI